VRWKFSRAKGSGVDDVGYAESTSLSVAAYELWRKYAQDAAPLNADIVWDYLRVEIWLDSGRIILFPTPSPFRYRVEKAMCQMVCPDLVRFYETLANASLPDEQLDLEIKRKEEEVANHVSDAGKKSKLPEQLGRECVAVLYYGSDLQKPIKRDEIKRNQ
jgi:hypothetical protein